MYKTTQTAALHREAAIPPMELLLDQRQHSQAVRVHQLDSHHPIYLRAMHRRRRPIRTRLLQAMDAMNTHPIEQADLLLTSPWDKNLKPEVQPTATPKAQSSEDFHSWLDSLPPHSMIVYTDGSKEREDTAAGAGWVGYWGTNRTKIFSGHRKLPNQEVFDAEARAALIGLQAALADPKAQHSSKMYICLDNLAAVQQLQGQPTGSSQSVFMSFQRTAQTWLQCPRAPGIQAGCVQVKWVPGHAGIEGNEAADKEAKMGCHAPLELPPPPTSIAAAKRAARRAHWQAFAQYWADKAPTRYKDLRIALEKQPPELLLPRATLGRLLAARSGHGDFAEYHERFKHEDALLTCTCGRRKEPTHFYYCRTGRKASAHPWGCLPASEILNSKAGATTFASWLEKSQFYTAICRRH